MNLAILNLDTIKDIYNGAVMEAFQEHLGRAVRDCVDRPADKRARRVRLDVTLKPVASVNGPTIDCEGARGVMQIHSRMPDHQTPEVDFGIRKLQKKGTVLVFNPDSPSNHRQTTLLDEESE